MDKGLEHKIRERAYAIWIDAGMIEGQAERHWLHAEATLRNEAKMITAAEARVVTAPVKPVAKPAKAKVAAKTTRAAAKPPSAARKARSVAVSALEIGA